MNDVWNRQFQLKYVVHSVNFVVMTCMALCMLLVCSLCFTENVSMIGSTPYMAVKESFGYAIYVVKLGLAGVCNSVALEASCIPQVCNECLPLGFHFCVCCKTSSDRYLIQTNVGQQTNVPYILPPTPNCI
jgi:hypothetical protein